MSAYRLGELFRTPRTARLADVLATRRDGPGALGLTLATAGVAVVLLALPRS